MFKSDVVLNPLCLFITLITLLILTWYLYYLYCFNYWKKKGIPSYPPSFPAGNITNSVLGKENLFISIQNYYSWFKRKGHKHGGLYFFNGPVYFPIDPEIIKSIFTTDFEHFVDRGMFVDEEKFPLTSHLFSLKGQRWKNLRNKLSPTFTSGKLKAMYEIFMRNTETFMDILAEKCQKQSDVNIKYLTANFTADVISSTTLDLEGGILKNPHNELARIIDQAFDPSVWLFLKTVLVEGLQNPGKLLRVMHSDKEVENFFRNLIQDTINHRKRNNISRNDFLQLLIEIRDKEGLSFNEILGQCFLFFLAGFETSAQTISFCVHELAHNQKSQEKLRSEIYENLGKDYRKYSYEDILKLPYLDQVFNETLRIYPILGFLNRICVKSYKIPGTNVIIEEGTPVLISSLGLQRDPNYFPEPLSFIPEKFDKKDAHVPFTFMPFGEGPRFCIGMRYGRLVTKLGIAALISQFKFLPSPETPKYIELDKMSKSLAVSPRKGITVKVFKL